jgi:hypothetical protein
LTAILNIFELSMTDIQAQAHAILISLVETPFDQCFEVSRKFEGLPNLAGLYVVRHRNNGVCLLPLAG